MTLSRRSFALGAAALAAAGAGYLGLFKGGYPPTPYDDLLHQIVDRRPAAALGKAVMRTIPRADAATLAAKLRQPGFALGRRIRDDATAGRLVEADGWIVPESVALYSALAAQF